MTQLSSYLQAAEDRASGAHRFIRIIVLFICCLIARPVFSQPSDSIRVLMLYGSRPARGHPEEPKWFGGRPGGHVAIQLGGDSTLNFSPTKYRPMCHIIARGKAANFRSTFRIRTAESFWGTFNYTHPLNAHRDSLMGLVIAIPVTAQQRSRLDSLTAVYLGHAPYDYAVLGMRCASATYEILAQTGLLSRPYRRHIWWHLLYPRDIRYQLLKEARGKDWRVYTTAGTTTRVWDRDRKL
jgi:hypothetical protein